MSAKVIIVGGGKGGVGKSTVAIAVVDALLETDKKVLFVDTDSANPDAYKALKNVVTSFMFNLEEESGYVNLGDLITDNRDSYVVVNTAARLTNAIVEHGDIVVNAASQSGREIIMLWPMNRQRDSIEQLLTFKEGVSGYAGIYAVLNTYFGSKEKFARFNNSTAANSAVTGVIVYPELNDLLADKLIDKRLALSNANDGLTVSEQFVLSKYRRAAAEALDGII